VFGLRVRLGLTGNDHSHEVEAGIRSIEAALAAQAAAPRPGAVEEAIAGTIDHVRAVLPPALAATIERVFVGFARRPYVRTDTAQSGTHEVVLPSWVPLSRLVGGYYVVRSIGRGAGGSVLLAVRQEQRTRPDRELVAVKIPDYSGDAARAMSETAFEALFREEASALLALPSHKNIAKFVTFDASAQPKPILVMEFVRGTNLERTLEGGELTMERALKIVDDLLAGLEAMHAIKIAHLDVKPPNLVLRESSGDAVLVDFGLAGRHIRTGCGSAQYGAAEVWNEAESASEPFASDVYAAACVAYEVLTGQVLIQGDTLQQLLDQHFSKQPGADALAQLGKVRGLDSLAELLRAALSRDPRRRPTIARLRAGFAAITRDLQQRSWPLGAA